MSPKNILQRLQLLSHSSTLLFALAIGGLLFPPALFAQNSQEPADGIEILHVDRDTLEQTEGLPSHLRITDPKLGRDLLLIRADNGYYFSDSNSPDNFGYFDFSSMEGIAKVELDDQGEVRSLTIPTRDEAGKLVDTPVDVSVDPATGALAVWVRGQEVPTKMLSTAAGPDLLIHTDGASQKVGVTIVIFLILLIIGCIISLNLCRSPCISACLAAGFDYINATATGCGRVTCNCVCERFQPELPPECV